MEVGAGGKKAFSYLEEVGVGRSWGCSPGHGNGHNLPMQLPKINFKGDCLLSIHFLGHVDVIEGIPHTEPALVGIATKRERLLPW